MKPLLAALCLLTYGCASAYHVPESTERLRVTLDTAQAEALLKKALGKSDSAHGLCASSVRLDRTAPKYVELKNGILLFEEYTRKDRDAGVARDFPLLDRRRDRFEFDFRNVSQLRVVNPGAAGAICARAPENRQVGIKDEHGMFINVDLAGSDFDGFVAAVLFLSPKARIAQGYGV